MASSGTTLLNMLRDSVTTPREAATRLLAIRPSLGLVLQGAALVSILDALLLGVLAGGSFAIPLPEGDMILNPFNHAALLLCSLVLSAGALQAGGQVLGGTGRFDQALLVVVWLEVVAIAVQLVQVVAALILPPLAPLLGLAGLVVLLWCVLNFTRILHGFPGFGRTVLALVVGALIVVVALSALFGIFGVGATPDV
ncbi:YIP1 family protein [Rubellimicrobium roseum]|uniref:Yip1 domain-containing protein n=1 Tax=Rubellimicrobium roseum TaxID=687525 RepID=A0A5C4NA07_9RHOB|nr:YIP1 family protein [Rubellimicrobium roseum]TNC67570.1 hypothetical protein FHG71_15340 [Rubellimicrobium roseum]